MKKITTFLFLAIFCFAAMASEIISKEAARTIAENLVFEKSGLKQTEVVFEKESIFEQDNTIYYYVFEKQADNGFVIISAHELISPVLGYSLSHSFSENPPSPSFVNWMQQYIDVINYMKEQNSQPAARIADLWNHYNLSSEDFAPKPSTKAVGALTDHIKWNQGGKNENNSWNQYCPSNNSGRALTGCVATAMGIIMKYDQYPSRGNGWYSYTPKGYEAQTINYGQQTYNYGSMHNSNATSEAAKLMHHAGVAVQMIYGPDGSGAYTGLVRDAMWYFFLYKAAEYHQRDNIDFEDVVSLLKKDLDEGRPVIFGGESSSGGHAFLIDGYDNNDMFHVNMGWGGHLNGFYSLSSIPEGYNSKQDFFTGLAPDNDYIAKRDTEDILKTAPKLAKILNLTDSEVRVFPNPTTGVFHVAVNSEVKLVEVFNLSGQKILSTPNANSIDLSPYKSGLYIITVQTEEGVSTQRLVLQ